MTTWQFFIDWGRAGDFSGTYDNITDDVADIRWNLGFTNPYDAVAPEAGCTITVRNTDGKYNPDNASGNLYGNLLPQRQVKIQAVTASGTVVMWRGFVRAIAPQWNLAAAQSGKLFAIIDCVGTKPIMQHTEVNLPLQQNKRTDEIIGLALQQVVLPPAVAGGWLLGIVGFSELGSNTYLADAGDYSALDTGVRTLQYYGDIRDLTKDNPPDPHRQNMQSAYRILRDMAETEPGRIFQRRDGKLVFHNRDTLIDYVASTGTVNDGSGQRPNAVMQAVGTNVLNRVRVTAYPRESQGSVTLWSLDESITVPPDDFVRMDAQFTDSDNRQCGASGTVTPSAVTSTRSTTTASIDQRADRAIVTFTNSGAVDDVITAFSITGTALMANNRFVVERANHDSIVIYGNRPELDLNLRGLDDYDAAVEIADFQLARRADVLLEVQAVSFLREANNTDNAHLFSWDLGDRIRVQIGDHDDYYWIVGEAHHVYKKLTIHECTFFLEPHHLIRMAGYNLGNRDEWVSLKGGTNERLGQQFTIPANHDVDEIRLFIGKVGTLPHNYTVKIYSNATLASGWLLGDATDSVLGTTTTLNTDDAYPDTLLATSDTKTDADVTGTGWLTFTLSATWSATGSTTYWIVLEASDASLVSYWPLDDPADLTSGLVSYWKLDETSGDATDAHGANTLTDNNTVTSAAGKLNTARQFTRANSEYLSITDAAQSGLDITGDITICAWVYLDSLPSANMAIVAKYGAAGQRSYSLSINTSNLIQILVSDDGTAIAGVNSSGFGALSTDTWYFIAARYDGSNIKLRINASDMTPAAHTTGIFDSSAFFGVGRPESDATAHFDGRIDEVGIWSRALTDAEVSALYANGAAKAYSAFEDGTRADAHGSNDLTDNNTVTQAIGLQGSAAQFTKANSEYLSIADASQSGLDITGSITIVCWIYLDQLPSTAGASFGIAGKYTNVGPDRGYLVYIATNDRVFFVVSPDGSATTTISGASSVVTAGAWYFIAARYDGSNLKLRLNTTDLTPVAYSSGIFNTATAFQVGAFQTSNYFDGRIDELGIWSRALTDAELTTLYNSGRGQNYQAARAFHDASNYLQWGADGSSPGYANGQMLYQSAGYGWRTNSKDAIFEVYAP